MNFDGTAQNTIGQFIEFHFLPFVTFVYFVVQILLR